MQETSRNCKQPQRMRRDGTAQSWKKNGGLRWLLWCRRGMVGKQWKDCSTEEGPTEVGSKTFSDPESTLMLLNTVSLTPPHLLSSTFKQSPRPVLPSIFMALNVWPYLLSSCHSLLYHGGSGPAGKSPNWVHVLMAILNHLCNPGQVISTS